MSDVLRDKALKDRWIPISKARSLGRIRKIRIMHPCPYCVAYSNICLRCELATDNGCCNGLWTAFSVAYNDFNLAEARANAIQIISYIKTH